MRRMDKSIKTTIFCGFVVLLAACKPTVYVTEVKSYGYIIVDGMPFLQLTKLIESIDFDRLPLNAFLTGYFFEDASEAEWIKEQIEEKDFEAILVRGPDSEEPIRLKLTESGLEIDLNYEYTTIEKKLR